MAKQFNLKTFFYTPFFRSHGVHRIFTAVFRSIERALLAAAVRRGHREAVDIIIHDTLNPNISLNEKRQTAAHIAASQDDVEMLLLLRSRGARFDALDAFKQTPIHVALDGKWENTLNYFLDEKHEIELPDNLLCHAAQKGSAELIRRLVNRGFLVNEFDPTSKKTPLFWAIENGHFESFETLCALGADLSHRSSEGLTPFLFAVKLGRIEFVRYFLSKKIKDDKGQNRTIALHLAVFEGHEACVELLLKWGFNPSAQDTVGRTPLILAKEKGFINIEYLLEGKKRDFETKKRQIIDVLREGKQSPNEFKQLIQGLPFNQSMIFTLEEVTQTLPLLHLVYKLSSVEYRKKLLTKLRTFKDFEPRVRDALGRTTDHIIAENGQDFCEIAFDLFAQDKEGNTPCHLYAASASADQLSNALQKQKKSVDIENIYGITPLLQAINAGKAENAHVLLNKGANPNYVTKTLLTPLFKAINNGEIEMVRLLIKLGADINQPFLSLRTTPLIEVIQMKQNNLVKLLIYEGADIHQSNREGMTPCMAAAKTGNLTLLRLLKCAGANLSAADHLGQTVAHYAVQSGNIAMIDFLINQGVSLETPTKTQIVSIRQKQTFSEGITPFHIASVYGSAPMMQQLVEQGVNSESKTVEGISPLPLATQSGRKEAVRFFRQYRLMDDSAQRITAIRMALAADNVSALKEFYRGDASVNAFLDFKGRTPLHLAAFLGAYNCAIYLVEQGADLFKQNLDQQIPLDLAIAHNQLQLTLYFIQEMGNLDLNTRQVHKKPYLHLACESGFIEMAALLIQLGVSLETEDFQGLKPIHVAAKQKNYRLLKLLLMMGARTKVKTPQGETVEMLFPISDVAQLVQRVDHARQTQNSLLHTAIRLNDSSYFPPICQRENVNTVDTEGETALHKATTIGNFTMVCQLLQLKANLEAKNKEGLSPLEIAIFKTKDLNLIRFFLHAGANAQVKDAKGNSLLYILTQLSDEAYTKQVIQILMRYIPRKDRRAPSLDMSNALANENEVQFFNLINLGHPLENEHFSLLSEASKRGNLPMMRLLLKWFDVSSLNPNHQDRQGFSPLHYAVLSLRLEAARLLVSCHVNLELRSLRGKTPLALAAVRSVEMTQFLVGSKANTNVQIQKEKEFTTRIGREDRRSNPSEMITLLETIYNQRNNLLQKGGPEISEFLLNVNPKQAKNLKRSYFIRACEKAFEEREDVFCLSKKDSLVIFKLIYDAIPKVNGCPFIKILEKAIKEDSVKLFLETVHKGEKVEDKMLTYTALHGGSQILYLLTKCFKVGFQVRDESGHTALHLAAKKGKISNVSTLLSLGASPNEKNHAGESILYTVAKSSLKNKNTIFRTLYKKLEKNNSELQGKYSDMECFNYLSSGYSIRQVSLMAARSNCVFTIKFFRSCYPKQLNLKALLRAARKENARQVINYINSLDDCIIL